MRILVLDLSVNRTGFALFESEKRNRKDRLLDYGVINNKYLSADQIGNKLKHIEYSLTGLLMAARPDVIVVEELTGRVFMDTTRNAMVHAILLKITANYQNVKYINNMEFKKNFTGNGKSTKKEVEDKMREYLPDVVIRWDDESDAISIGIYYMMKEGLAKW